MLDMLVQDSPHTQSACPCGLASVVIRKQVFDLQKGTNRCLALRKISQTIPKMEGPGSTLRDNNTCVGTVVGASTDKPGLKARYTVPWQWKVALLPPHTT